MKQIFAFIGLLAYQLIGTLVFAQAPQKMSYQAVIRNASNALVMNTTVGMQISILQGSAVGTPVYVETQTPTTNSNGLASLQIGNGVVVSGTFATIDWATGGPYFIKTETDPLGGIVYTITGTTQMLSTPYSLYAEKSGGLTTPLGKSHLIISGDVTDAQAATQIANEVGLSTQFVWILNTTALTTINLSTISDLVEIRMMNNAALTNINLNGLTKITGNVSAYSYLTSISVNDNPALSTLSFPMLTSVGGNVSIYSNPNLASFSVPLLTKVNGQFSIQNSLINSISMPSLIRVNDFFGIYSNSSLTNVSLPLFQSVGQLAISNNPLLNTISLPSLNNMTFLSNLFASFQYNALPPSQVNALLNQMLTVTPPSGKSLSFNYQSPLAPPSGAGVTAKAALIAAGNTVLTD
jgi:hypothetical protein